MKLIKDLTSQTSREDLPRAHFEITFWNPNFRNPQDSAGGYSFLSDNNFSDNGFDTLADGFDNPVVSQHLHECAEDEEIKIKNRRENDETLQKGTKIRR